MMKVRIPFALADDGEWNATAWSGQDKSLGLRVAMDSLKGEIVLLCWIEAEIEIPEQGVRVVKATVRPAVEEA